MEKKRILRIISICCAICVFVALTTIVIYTLVNRVGVTTVSLGSEKVASGDVVEIPLTLKKNHGMWGGQIIINYDPEAISFVSCENGDLFDDCEVNNNEGEVVLLVKQKELKNMHKNGDIAMLKFKAKVSADSGDYNIVINQDTNFGDINENIIETIFKNGIISVK